MKKYEKHTIARAGKTGAIVAMIVAEIAADFFWTESKVSEALACGAMIPFLIKYLEKLILTQYGSQSAYLS
jgi:hypothetical protein|tara:strand:- start:761 stop:973 length:213 start_codon:yes stop_codon:yes gene_type:complete